MNPDISLILDRALRHSLEILLGTYVVILLIARHRLHRKRKVGDLYEAIRPGEPNDNWAPSFLDQWRIVFNSLVFAVALAAIFFVTYLFLPLPFLDNLVTSTAWQVSPLRVTAIQYDRFYEGFSVEGEVWNQTREPLSGIQAQIEVIASDDKPLAQLDSSVVPDPLDPGRPGIFQFRYSEHSPFIKGYRLSFKDSEGKLIPHLTGFDVR